MGVRLVVWLIVLGLAPPLHAAATIPARLTDVRGTEIDVAGLAARRTLIVVTVKSASCPVCQEQLRRLAALEARFRACGASFIVLAPGPTNALRRIAERSGFAYPFVEDTGLAVARSLGLVLEPDEIAPAFLHVDETREVVWTQRGRAAGAYGDAALLEHLRCDGNLTARAGGSPHGQVVGAGGQAAGGASTALN
jgi:peroxiredoxin